MTATSGSAKPCPICGKPAGEKTAPFCSPRCADVDLNRWLKGTYAIPAVETDEEDGEEGGGDGPADSDGAPSSRLH